MAKLVVTYEKGEIKKELFYKGEVFSYSMLPSAHGKSGNAKCFDAQFEEKYGSENEELLEAAYQMDFGDEDEIEESLSILSHFE